MPLGKNRCACVSMARCRGAVSSVAPSPFTPSRADIRPGGGGWERGNVADGRRGRALQARFAMMQRDALFAAVGADVQTEREVFLCESVFALGNAFHQAAKAVTRDVVEGDLGAEIAGVAGFEHGGD